MLEVPYQFKTAPAHLSRAREEGPQGAFLVPSGQKLTLPLTQSRAAALAFNFHFHSARFQRVAQLVSGGLPVMTGLRRCG